MARKNPPKQQLVRLRDRVVIVRNEQDENGFGDIVIYDALNGEILSVHTSRLNGFGSSGSTDIWIEYYNATRDQREALARENLRIAETPEEVRRAQEEIDLAEFSRNFKPSEW